MKDNWIKCPLSHLVYVLNGYAFKSKKYVEDGIRVIRIANVQDGYIEDDKPAFYPYETQNEISGYMLDAGDLLMSLTGNVGRVALLTEELLPAALNQRVACLRIKNKKIVDRKFLFYYFRQYSFQKECIDNAKGTAQLNMSTEWLKKYNISLPPLAEQKRIVEQIENLFSKLDEAKNKLELFIKDSSDRKAALINKGFTGELTQLWRQSNNSSASEYLAEIDDEISKIKKKKSNKVSNDFGEYIYEKIPEQWCCVDLEQISRLITDGEHKTPQRVDEYCGFYLLSARNVYDDSLRLDDVDYVDESEFEKISKRCNPKRGDVLISCSGSVGRTCVIEDDNNYCMVRSAAMVSLIKCNPRFVMYMLQSGYVQEQIKKLTKQTAQANLFLGAISALVIPLPTKEEQDEIVRILDDLLNSMYSAQEVAEKNIMQIDLMKKAILAKAFRGELGTNIADEESSIELLKSIIEA